MTRFISLTQPKDGKIIWVNPTYISTFTGLSNGTGSAVCIGDDPNPIVVCESPEIINQKISVIK